MSSGITLGFRMTLAEQGDHFHQSRIARESLPFKHRGRAQRQQPHQGPHLQPDRLAVGEPQQIIEEAVLLVPHLVVTLADAVHGIGDPQEMLGELEGDILVDRVLLAQDQGDVQHALAVERHPGRPVRLLQRAAGGGAACLGRRRQYCRGPESRRRRRCARRGPSGSPTS